MNALLQALTRPAQPLALVRYYLWAGRVFLCYTGGTVYGTEEAVKTEVKA